MSEIPDSNARSRPDGPGEVALTERQLWELAAGESVTVEVACDHGADSSSRVTVTPPVPPVPTSHRE